MTEKKHLSFTQLNMFLRCPRQYEYRYVLGQKIPPSGAMVQSRAWHRALEYNYRQKIESDQDLPLSDMQDYFVSEFDSNLSSEEIAFQPDERPGALKDQGTVIVATHHTEIAPSVHPAIVEEQFTVDLGDDFPFSLTGIWDLIERDGTIVDNKAYGKTPRQEDLDKDLQFSTYSLAYRALYHRTEPRLRMDAVVKNVKPKAVQLYTQRSNSSCQWLLRLIEQVGMAITAGTYYPNPNGWHCSPTYCGFWNQCMGESP
jgi:RecB family exonuclease